MGKPTRSVRRFIRRRAGAVRQNKGKGRGKGAGAFLASLTDDEVDIFLGRKGKGKGKSKGKRTSGKGLGRKRNPIGRDGTVMTCNTCGSEEHFANNCDASGPQGRSSQQITYAGTASSSLPGPFGDLQVSSRTVLMISDSVSSNIQQQDAEPDPGVGWAVPPAAPYLPEPQAASMPTPFNPWADFSRRSAMEAANANLQDLWQRVVDPSRRGCCTRCGANLDEDERCWRCAFRPGDAFRTQ